MVSNLAKTISDISKKEPALLHYTASEVEENIQSDRAVIIQVEGKVAAFGFWNIHGDWVEVSTLYVFPEFRGKGYASRLIKEVYEKLAGKYKKTFLFTFVPQVMTLAKQYGMQQSTLSQLPFRVLLRLVLHRINPIRWPSYLYKFFTGRLRLKFKLFILTN